MNQLVEKLRDSESGAKEITTVGDAMLADESMDHLKVAKALLSDGNYHVRMLAT